MKNTPPPSLVRNIKTEEEVEEFLCHLRQVLNHAERCQLNTLEWRNAENKTRSYMAETNIKKKDIIKVIRELEVSNYSYTTPDRNDKFSGEEFWIFGKKYNLIDRDEDYYIKLKIRRIDTGEFLLIMSFHPEQPVDGKKLQFPYGKIKKRKKQLAQ